MNIFLCFILLSETFISLKNISNIKFSFCLFLLCCHSPGSFWGNNQNANISVRLMHPDSAGSFGHEASWQKLEEGGPPLEGIWDSSEGVQAIVGPPQQGKGGKRPPQRGPVPVSPSLDTQRFLNDWALWDVGWKGQGSIAGFTEQHLKDTHH